MKVTIGEHDRYVDAGLHKQLMALKKAVHQDLDGLIYLFGREGSGKSTFAFQIASILDENFGIDKVAWTPEQFMALVKAAKKYDCIVLDEAYLTFTNQNRMNHFQKVIIGLLTMIRSKNLFIIIVSPTFFDLSKYLIVHRSLAAIRVYFKGSEDGVERGYWELYGEESKLRLYIKGRKDNNLSVVGADMRGRFTKWFPLDKEEYDRRKNDAVMSLQAENEKKQEEKPQNHLKPRREGAVWLYYELQKKRLCKQGAGVATQELLRMSKGSFSNYLQQAHRVTPFTDNSISDLSDRNTSLTDEERDDDEA
jgi:hypothetical protein